MEALIPKVEKEPVKSSRKLSEPEGQRVLMLEIEAISPNRYQPRKMFNEIKLEELAASLQERGIIQPVTVRPVEGGYELIAGERRFEAAKRAGMSSIPAIVKDATDRDMLELSLVENIQRDDLNPIEEASAYKQLMDEFGLTQEKLADEVGKDRATVANTVRLLKLPAEVQKELSNEKLSRGHAVALLGLNNSDEQVRLCRRIVRQGLSVRETEVLVKRGLRAYSPARRISGKTPALIAIEQKLQHFFGTKVHIKERKKGGGRIELEYYSEQDMERFLSLLDIKLD